MQLSLRTHVSRAFDGTDRVISIVTSRAPEEDNATGGNSIKRRIGRDFPSVAIH